MIETEMYHPATNVFHLVWFEYERSDERPAGPSDSLFVTVLSAVDEDDNEVEPADWMVDIITQRIADGEEP